jgi:hypothetical protein
MSLDLGAGADHAQIFGVEVETLPAVERDGQNPAILGEPQLGWPRAGVIGGRHGVSHYLEWLYI